jgi:hypothetical protein
MPAQLLYINADNLIIISYIYGDIRLRSIGQSKYLCRPSLDEFWLESQAACSYVVEGL